MGGLSRYRYVINFLFIVIFIFIILESVFLIIFLFLIRLFFFLPFLLRHFTDFVFFIKTKMFPDMLFSLIVDCMF